MKSGSTSHRPSPPAVDRSPAKKFKRVNMKQNSAANVGTDAREGLMDLKLMHQAPFLLARDLSNAISAKGWGHVKRVCPSHLNYTRGGMPEEEHSSPKTGACRHTDSDH